MALYARRVLSSLVVLVLLAPVGAQLVRREKKRDAGSSQLHGALRKALRSVPADRLMHVEESLRASYEAFPKDSRGNLPPHRVLPALVRSYFAKEHGWLLRGLETPGAAIIAPGETFRNSHGTNAETGEITDVQILQDKAPELASALKDVTLRPASSASGLSLGDVVQTVASLEQLLLGESLPLLKAAYFLNQHGDENTQPSLEESDLNEVLQSYLLLFRHGIPRNLTDSHAHARMRARARRSYDWNNITQFVSQAVGESSHLKDASGNFSWDAASSAVLTLAQRYGEFQNRECGEMKSALMSLDTTGSGRVSLPDFHGAPGHPHYQFTEGENFLRKAGILSEEPNSGLKEVLIANYLLGPSNCIASSEYFAVCCLNECDGIMNEIEGAMQSAAGLASQVADAVAAIRVERSMAASRSLPTELMQSLTDAADDAGAVVLHSAAFRQWLHRVFPNECPRPSKQEDAAEEAERSEAREWLEIDEAARQKWEPLVLHPSECTRIPEWHTQRLAEASVGSDGESLLSTEI
eukprot:TRINITY_DN34622_c0_g1_i1.p1 TRINITY_DN34622_c0_g1~~TRINITY_DN34622_c0_g1_i1.p1  ORF type:complete len:526 (-),score=81.48 TRINITY_DN34622_c0_g1_i1:64-1641(-)